MFFPQQSCDSFVTWSMNETAGGASSANVAGLSRLIMWYPALGSEGTIGAISCLCACPATGSKTARAGDAIYPSSRRIW